MFDVGEKIRSAASAGIATVISGAAAMLGCVYLSIAVIMWLERSMSPEAARALVGGLLLVPLLIVVLRGKLSKPAPQAQQAAHAQSDYAMASVAQLAGLVEKLADRAPLASAGVAIAAGVLAARAPGALALFVQILSQAFQRRQDEPKA